MPFSRLLLLPVILIFFYKWSFAASIALIIDDFGNNPELGVQAIELPGVYTAGILPGTPYATMLAEMANAKGHEIMVHVPMESEHHKALGPGALQLKMSEYDFKQTLEAAIEAVPNAKGLNNHMGSLLTQHQLPMQWIMESLKRHDLYFIDSRTTVETVAQQVAEFNQVPNLRRDVFLDNERTFEAIQKQFAQLVRLAKKRGFATGIAHPYPETLKALKLLLPELDKQGVKLVKLSDYLKNTQSNRRDSWPEPLSPLPKVVKNLKP